MDEIGDKTNESKPAQDAREYSVSSRPPMSQLTGHVPALAKVRGKLPKHMPSLRRPVGAVVVGIVISALVGFGAGWFGAGYRNGGSGILTGTISPEKQIVTSESQLINSIAKTVGPSVVSVNVTSTSQGSSSPFGFGYLPQSEQSAGTGIILTSAGLIITNRHVVPAGTTSVSVILSDGTELKDVSVVGRTSPNSSLDIAFLKINNAQGEKLIPATIGDSSKVEIGAGVVAIGNALGQFQNTVTSGIISGHGRSVQASSSDNSQNSENLEDLFQTDAAINEGNSGGPLVNMNGQVIGINTAIAGNAQNIGFAIPINDVVGLIKQVESSGKLQQPYLGVYYIPITSDVAQQYSLGTTDGAWVPPVGILGQNPIVPGGPADKAGVQPGDIITKIDGTSINQGASLTSIIGRDNIGQAVTLTVLRNGKTLNLKAALAAAPSDATNQ